MQTNQGQELLVKAERRLLKLQQSLPESPMAAHQVDTPPLRSPDQEAVDRGMVSPIAYPQQDSDDSLETSMTTDASDTSLDVSRESRGSGGLLKTGVWVSCPPLSPLSPSLSPPPFPAIHSLEAFMSTDAFDISLDASRRGSCGLQNLEHIFPP